MRDAEQFWRVGYFAGFNRIGGTSRCIGEWSGVFLVRARRLTADNAGCFCDRH